MKHRAEVSKQCTRERTRMREKERVLWFFFRARRWGFVGICEREKKKTWAHEETQRRNKARPRWEKPIGAPKITRSHEETERKKKRERYVTLWRFFTVVIMRRFFYFFVFFFFIIIIIFFFFSFPFFFFLLFLLFMVVIPVVFVRLVLMLLLLVLRMSRMEEVVVRSVPFVEGVGEGALLGRHCWLKTEGFANAMLCVLPKKNKKNEIEILVLFCYYYYYYFCLLLILNAPTFCFAINSKVFQYFKEYLTYF